MDDYEATKIVFQRIKAMDPENASKIMGFLLIQDHVEKDMIRLAHGPESSLQSVILKAKKELNLAQPNTPLTSSSSWTSSSCFPSEPFRAATNREDEDHSPSSSELLGHKNSDLYLSASYSSSVNHRTDTDVCVQNFSDDGFCWRPCLFYARGYCKNGTSCRFSHGLMMMSSPMKLEMTEQCRQEMLGSKSTQRVQDNNSVHVTSSPHNFSYPQKSMNFLHIPSDSPRGFRTRFEHMNGMNSRCSRQIYLTFPADSAFKEEDVSNYFSTFGPVQDVRIPHQQKRMFGFVTFDYSETVKLILAKGNPHFVRDARVLVKPYKEKGKIPDKLRIHQQQIQGDPYDLQLSARLLYDNIHDTWRRKLEQADLQQAIELQNMRLLNLQLHDVKRHHRTPSNGSVVSSSPVFSSNLNDSDAKEEKSPNPEKFTVDSSDKPQDFHVKGSDLPESGEHNLPDSPFATPKASENHMTGFAEPVKGDVVLTPINGSSLTLPSTEECNRENLSAVITRMIAMKGKHVCNKCIKSCTITPIPP